MRWNHLLASVALADAGINMRDIVTACAAGKVDEKDRILI